MKGCGYEEKVEMQGGAEGEKSDDMEKIEGKRGTCEGKNGQRAWSGKGG